MRIGNQAQLGTGIEQVRGDARERARLHSLEHFVRRTDRLELKAGVEAQGNARAEHLLLIAAPRKAAEAWARLARPEAAHMLLRLPRV